MNTCGDITQIYTIKQDNLTHCNLVTTLASISRSRP